MQIPDRFLPTNRIARQIANLARERDVKIATIESCTAGMLSTVLGSVPGGSLFIGFVTYTNMAKRTAGVPDEVLAHPDGPYTQRTAEEMATALLATGANKNLLAISTTGVLDRQDGKYPHVRRGKVYVGFSSHLGNTVSHELSIRVGRRKNMQRRVVRKALLLAKNYLQQIPQKNK